MSFQRQAYLAEEGLYGPLNNSKSRRMAKTGEGLERIQKEMAAIRPVGPIAEFPTDPQVIQEMMGCVRCQLFPNAKDYMTCEEKEHIVCGSCATISPGLSGWHKGRELKQLESCCSTPNLRRGNNRLLEHLLNYSKWECFYNDKGCRQIIVGHKWSEHVKLCEFSKLLE